jgi:hypothetical protein
MGVSLAAGWRRHGSERGLEFGKGIRCTAGSQKEFRAVDGTAPPTGHAAVGLVVQQTDPAGLNGKPFQVERRGGAGHRHGPQASQHGGYQKKVQQTEKQDGGRGGMQTGWTKKDRRPGQPAVPGTTQAAQRLLTALSTMP